MRSPPSTRRSNLFAFGGKSPMVDTYSYYSDIPILVSPVHSTNFLLCLLLSCSRTSLPSSSRLLFFILKVCPVQLSTFTPFHPLSSFLVVQWNSFFFFQLFVDLLISPHSLNHKPQPSLNPKKKTRRFKNSKRLKKVRRSRNCPISLNVIMPQAHTYTHTHINTCAHSSSRPIGGFQGYALEGKETRPNNIRRAQFITTSASHPQPTQAARVRNIRAGELVFSSSP